MEKKPGMSAISKRGIVSRKTEPLPIKSLEVINVFNVSIYVHDVGH